MKRRKLAEFQADIPLPPKGFFWPLIGIVVFSAILFFSADYLAGQHAMTWVVDHVPYLK